MFVTFGVVVRPGKSLGQIKELTSERIKPEGRWTSYEGSHYEVIVRIV
jgi:hypothetical protein